MQSTTFLREFVHPSDGPAFALVKQDETPGKEAYAKGLEDGLAQGRDEIAVATLETIRHLVAKLDDMSALQDRMVADMTAEAGMVLSTVIRTIAPHLATLGVADQALKLLENELRDAPRPLSISVSPEVAERLEAMMADALDPEFSINADAAMSATQIEVAWPEGGAIVDTDALADRIIGLTQDLIPHSTPMEENPHDQSS